MADEKMGQLYRSYAAQEQAYADQATLENVRRLHHTAAARWRDLAERADRVNRLK